MLKHEHHKRGPRLVAAFNSLGRECGFEWKKALEESGNSSLHLMGQRRTWYHFCIEGVIELLEEYKPDLLIGASMGGYAALMFGSLLNIRATAFGPQTTLQDVPWDRRWQKEWAPIRLDTDHPELLDLSTLTHRSDTKIYYCKGVLEDKLHAEKLKRVIIIPRGCERHEQASQNLHTGVFD